MFYIRYFELKSLGCISILLQKRVILRLKLLQIEV